MNSEIEAQFVLIVNNYKHCSLNILLSQLALAYNNINNSTEISIIMTNVITKYYYYSLDDLCNIMTDVYNNIYNQDIDMLCFDKLTL